MKQMYVVKSRSTGKVVANAVCGDKKSAKAIRDTFCKQDGFVARDIEPDAKQAHPNDTGLPYYVALGPHHPRYNG